MFSEQSDSSELQRIAQWHREQLQAQIPDLEEGIRQTEQHLADCKQRRQTPYLRGLMDAWAGADSPMDFGYCERLLTYSQEENEDCLRKARRGGSLLVASPCDAIFPDSLHVDDQTKAFPQIQIAKVDKMSISNEAELSVQQIEAWLDWMIFIRGVEVGAANNLALAEPSEGEHYEKARSLLREWNKWRS